MESHAAEWARTPDESGAMTSLEAEGAIHPVAGQGHPSSRSSADG